jgi:hypothetical protein
VTPSLPQIRLHQLNCLSQSGIHISGSSANLNMSSPYTRWAWWYIEMNSGLVVKHLKDGNSGIVQMLFYSQSGSLIATPTPLFESFTLSHWIGYISEVSCYLVEFDVLVGIRIIHP